MSKPRRGERAQAQPRRPGPLTTASLADSPQLGQAGWQMLKPEHWMDIKILHQQGLSIRRIAHQTGLSRNSVRRVLRQNAPQSFKTPQRSSKLDPFKDYLRQRVERYDLSAVRLIDEIREMGYQGSVQTVRRFLASLPRSKRLDKAMTVRFETPPGRQAQVDWQYAGRFPDSQGRMISVYAFVMVLSFSRMIYVEFTTSMKLPVLIACHLRAFAFFGGWPQHLLFDNMKQVKLNSTQWNPLFQDFLSHHHLTASTHRPYRPKTKGKVERAIQYLDDNFLTARSFDNLDHLNHQALNWCNHTANTRIHGTTKARPIDLFGKENLTSLSAVPTYTLACSTPRRVDRESMVAFDRSRYSVPPEHVGCSVQVRSHAGLITIHLGDMILAEHQEAAQPGSSVVNSKHMAELWKRSVPQPGTDVPTLPHWHLSFDQQTVAVTPLDIYQKEAA
ncbi:MAG: IS21 family transposase [Candidatus Competibacteraceae bacterium]|nr:IS21 family transposase [Candidatus Competibacteraceae bacterium]